MPRQGPGDGEPPRGGAGVKASATRRRSGRRVAARGGRSRARWGVVASWGLPCWAGGWDAAAAAVRRSSVSRRGPSRSRRSQRGRAAGRDGYPSRPAGAARVAAPGGARRSSERTASSPRAEVAGRVPDVQRIWWRPAVGATSARSQANVRPHARQASRPRASASVDANLQPRSPGRPSPWCRRAPVPEVHRRWCPVNPTNAGAEIVSAGAPPAAGSGSGSAWVGRPAGRQG